MNNKQTYLNIFIPIHDGVGGNNTETAILKSITDLQDTVFNRKNIHFYSKSTRKKHQTCFIYALTKDLLVQLNRKNRYYLLSTHGISKDYFETKSTIRMLYHIKLPYRHFKGIYESGRITNKEKYNSLWENSNKKLDIGIITKYFNQLFGTHEVTISLTDNIAIANYLSISYKDKDVSNSIGVLLNGLISLVKPNNTIFISNILTNSASFFYKCNIPTFDEVSKVLDIYPKDKLNIQYLDECN